MAAGISSPGDYVWRERRSLAIILGPLMVMMWMVSSLGIKIIFGLSWTESFIIGACVTPTDPVLANSIIQGSFADAYIPVNVRHLLSAESAANDGLGLVFILIPLYLSRFQFGEGIGLLFLKVIGYQIVISVIFGIVVGFMARTLLQIAHERHYIDKVSILAFSIALALTISGSLSLLGIDDILACYVAGVVISWDCWLNAQIQESNIQEVIDMFLNFTYFVLYGTLIPWNLFGTPGLEYYKLIMYSLWFLALRRLPFALLFIKYVPALKDYKEAFFFGVCFIINFSGLDLVELQGYSMLHYVSIR